MRFERALAIAISLALFAPSAFAQNDVMSEYRDRFKAGLARYQAGALGEALQLWEPIFREIGPERGWRLAFNIARAYDGIGDTTRAVERYEAFLVQVEARRARGEPLEPLIVREDEETRARLAEVTATKGRIRVEATEPPVSVRIDGSEPRLAGFTAYVAPGKHTIVFEPGTPRESSRTLEIAAGALIAVEPPRPAPALTIATPAPRELRMVRAVERPFPEAVLWVAAGITAASTLVPILTYGSAASFQAQNRLAAENDPLSQEANARVRADYDSKKTTYYATLAIPISLAVATGALTGWYFLGTRVREVPVVTLAPGGASVHVQRSF